MPRADLNALPAPAREELAGLILPYLTDEVVRAHTEIVHFGEQSFIGHSAYVEGLERYLASRDAGRFVPLPQWDPANPIPPEFAMVRAQDNGIERPPLVNLDPGMPLPPEFVPPLLCDFQNADALGNEINPWHIHVHTTVGGALGKFPIASSAPIFWCFHVFVSEVYQRWQRVCQSAAAAMPAEG